MELMQHSAVGATPHNQHNILTFSILVSLWLLFISACDRQNPPLVYTMKITRASAHCMPWSCMHWSIKTIRVMYALRDKTIRVMHALTLIVLSYDPLNRRNWPAVGNTHNACTSHAFTACTGHACMCMHNIETGWIATPGTTLPDGVQTVYIKLYCCVLTLIKRI